MSDTLVIDTSVFIAILALEPDAKSLSAVIRRYQHRLMTAASYVECAIAAGRWQAGRAELDDWVRRRSIEIIP